MVSRFSSWTIDWKYRNPERDIEDRSTEERALFPDAKVCVFGVWNGNALVPDPKRPRGLPVYPGEIDHVREELSGTGKFFFGLGVILLIIFIVWGHSVLG